MTIVFSSSLRKRQEWALIVQSLRSSPSWQETTLEACDITFPIADSSVPPVLFRAIVSSLSELQSKEGKARAERLLLMSGGEHLAVLLLLDGDNSMEVFCRIQADMLLLDSVVPLIPISTTRELQNCVESFRRDYGNTASCLNTERSVAHKELVSWCVEGKPLGRDQTNLLTGITSGFRDFAGLYTHPDGRATICEYLGQEDGKRVIAFLANGPSHIKD